MNNRLAFIAAVLPFAALACVAPPARQPRAEIPVAGISGTLVRSRPANVGFSDVLVPRIDSIILAAIADSATPGATIAIARHGKLVLLKGYGRTDWADSAPAANDSTIYDLASLTKVVAATTAAMILEEEGKLDLDRTVASYLPEYDQPDKRAITVRMLLTHTSGVRSNHPLWRDAKGREGYLAAMAKHPLAFTPGAQALYTDWNMLLLQFVIERITGQMLDEFVAARVSGPLGMRDTGYNPPASLKPRIAPTEIKDYRNGQVWGEVHDETAWALGGVSGNAGLFSSARDLAVFMQMMVNGGSYGDTRIAKPATIARWTAPQRGDASRALGWDTPSPNSSAGNHFSPRSFGHTGFTGTSIWADPEKGLFVVLLTNRVNPTRENQKIGPLRRAIADVIQESLPAECPPIAPPDAAYPYMQYVTWVIDGHVVQVRQPQLVSGIHGVGQVDSIFAIDRLNPNDIDEIKFPTGESALKYETCPGVRVVEIRTKPHIRTHTQAPVPVHAEPRHRMVWEAGSIRVLDVQFVPGDTSLYHIHDAPILYIPISISSMDAQPLGGNWIGLGPTSPSRFSLATTDADTSYALRPVTHRVANVGTLPFRLIAITNGRSRAEIDAGPANDPLPGVLQHKSSWFYQTRVSLPAGETTSHHTASSPVVIVQPGLGQLHVDARPASRSQVLNKPGSFTFLPAGTGFTLHNASTEATSVVIARVR